MSTKAPLMLVLFLLASVSAAVAQDGSQPPRPESQPTPQTERLKSGIAHFEKAFYELTPQKRGAEADSEFAKALAEFEAEVAASPASIEAHTYLARIYAFRKNFRKAGAHYDQVAALQPFNVDACVLAALAYIDAKDFADARLRLVDAKGRTLDPEVLARLDEYIARVDALSRES
jgi:cytochrome c-type biogenesis protein CcmH/NrfG